MSEVFLSARGDQPKAPSDPADNKQERPEPPRILLRELKDNCSTKRDLYNVLKQGKGYYLPPHRRMTSYFIKALYNMTKKGKLP